MNEIGFVLLNVFIGSVIGGLTNSIAIYMLFRPYQAITLFGRRMNFTQGLIPKRHPEMAKQLGDLVEKHLFTLESIQKKLITPSFQAKVHGWARIEWEKLLSTSKTLNEMTTRLINEQQGMVPGEIVEEKVTNMFGDKIDDWWEGNKNKELKLVVPLDDFGIDDKIESGIEFLFERGREFLYSLEGEEFLYHFLQKGMEKQGPLGSMLGMFISKEALIDRVRPVLVQWMNQPSTKQKLLEQIHKFKEEFLQKELRELIKEETKNKAIQTLLNQLQKQMKIKDLFDQPLSKILEPYKGTILSYIPKAIDQLGVWTYKQSPELFRQIEISEMVREQVLAFPLRRLELMIRELANKELKLITWLGAFLGGLIGLMQAIILLFLL
jgi:uncharacterized membrane protein YheB (UPF0754 family)